MHVEDGGSNKRNVYILTCLLVHLLKYILDKDNNICHFIAQNVAAGTTNADSPVWFGDNVWNSGICLLRQVRV